MHQEAATGLGLPSINTTVDGNITEGGIWKDQNIPSYANDLALITLKILEHQ